MGTNKTPDPTINIQNLINLKIKDRTGWVVFFFFFFFFLSGGVGGGWGAMTWSNNHVNEERKSPYNSLGNPANTLVRSPQLKQVIQMQQIPNTTYGYTCRLFIRLGLKIEKSIALES